MRGECVLCSVGRGCRKTTTPNMWSVLAGDASRSHKIAIIRSKHTYLLSQTAHLALSRTRRRMPGQNGCLLHWPGDTGGQGTVASEVMQWWGMYCTVHTDTGVILDILDCSRLLALQFLNCTLAHFKMPYSRSWTLSLYCSLLSRYLLVFYTLLCKVKLLHCSVLCV